MADTDAQYPHERLNAHAMLERVEQFFQRLDQDHAARTKETEGRPSITQGVGR